MPSATRWRAGEGATSFGGADIDLLLGGAGQDTLYGNELSASFADRIDTLDGQEDGDNYVATNNSGDAYRDTGTQGVDTILAGRAASGALFQLRLPNAFSQASSGIEGIEGGAAFTTVRIQPTVNGQAVDWNFSAVELRGVDQIWGGTGIDRIVGSAGADRIDGQGNNNTMDGGEGSDVFVARVNGGVQTITDAGGVQDAIELQPFRGFSSLEAHVSYVKVDQDTLRLEFRTASQSLPGAVVIDGMADAATQVEFLRLVNAQGVTVAQVDLREKLGPVNQPPDAHDDAFALNEDAFLSENVLLDNGAGPDADPDNDPITVRSVDGDPARVNTEIALGSGALLRVNANGTFTYDPSGAFDNLAAGETATETFSYEIVDGRGGTDTATATITVQGVGSTSAADRWAQGYGVDEISNPDPQADDVFGLAVALSADGQTLVVGAPRDDEQAAEAGAAYALRGGPNQWAAAEKLTPTAGGASDAFGFELAIDGDGDTLLGGAQNTQGIAVIFGRAGGWGERPVPPRHDASYATVALSDDGTTGIVGAFDNAYILERDGGGWHETAALPVTGYGSTEVAISGDGLTCVVTGNGTDALSAFRRGPSGWAPYDELNSAIPGNGGNLAISDDSQIVLAATDILANQARIITDDGSGFGIAATLVSSDGSALSGFGSDVDLIGGRHVRTGRCFLWCRLPFRGWR